MKSHLFFLFFFLSSVNCNHSFAQDTTFDHRIHYRLGLGIFSIPGLYVEKPVTEKIFLEAGLISCILFDEASVAAKYRILGKNKFKIKAGIGCGLTAYFWSAKTDPPKSGQDIFVLPLIPVEFSYGRFSLEIEPGYPFKLSGEDASAIPVITFLSFALNK